VECFNPDPRAQREGSNVRCKPALRYKPLFFSSPVCGPRLHYRLLTLCPAPTDPVPRGLLTLGSREGQQGGRVCALASGRVCALASLPWPRQLQSFLGALAYTIAY